MLRAPVCMIPGQVHLRAADGQPQALPVHLAGIILLMAKRKRARVRREIRSYRKTQGVQGKWNDNYQVIRSIQTGVGETGFYPEKSLTKLNARVRKKNESRKR